MTTAITREDLDPHALAAAIAASREPREGLQDPAGVLADSIAAYLTARREQMATAASALPAIEYGDGQLSIGCAPILRAYGASDFPCRDEELTDEEHDAELERLAQLIATLAENGRQTLCLTKAAGDVLGERQRQVREEGWTPEHDDTHKGGELARAAATYAVEGGRLFTVNRLQVPQQVWPYRWEYVPKDRRRDLVRAGALIIAEIERLDRAS